MLPFVKLKVAKLKDPVLIFVIVAGGLLLHHGKPPDEREHTTFEMTMMGVGICFLIFGLVYLIAIWLKGSVSNPHEGAILSGVQQNVDEDRRRRGSDE